MLECDYCDASFDEKDAYLVHLKNAHDKILEPEDEQRVKKLQANTGSWLTKAALGVVLLVTVGITVYVTMFMGSSLEDSTGLPEQGDDTIISQVQTEPASSIQHVETGTKINYSQVPPTGGEHYSTTVSAGFYSEPQPLGALVHSLEHGAVVVYYDPAQLTESAKADLNSYAESQTGHWQSFIAVPNPKDEPESAYTLTAWEKRLTMDKYEEETVEAFVAEFIGRGPENPVR